MGIQEIFACNMRSYRRQANLTQEKLAELCGFHRTYIGGIEQRRINVSLKNIAKIANALNVNPALLFVNNDGMRLRIAPRKGDDSVEVGASSDTLGRSADACFSDCSADGNGSHRTGDTDSTSSSGNGFDGRTARSRANHGEMQPREPLQPQSQSQTPQGPQVASTSPISFKSGDYALCSWTDNEIIIDPIRVIDEDMTIRILSTLASQECKDIIQRYDGMLDLVEMILKSVERLPEKESVAELSPLQ